MLVAANVAAQGFTYQGVEYRVVDDGAKTCAASGYTDAIESQLVLPETAYDGTTGYTLVRIEDFRHCNKLTSVVIPESVTEISSSAFRDCSYLSSITLPSAITTIQSSTFSGCTSLSAITLPSNLKTIDWYVFENCRSLESITIPSSVTSIGKEAFKGCTRLKSVTVEGETKCGDYVFSGCTLKPLLIKGRIYWNSSNYPFAYLNDDSYIICRSNEAANIRKRFKGRVFTFDDPYIISSVTPLIFGVKFSIEANPYYEGEATADDATVTLARYNYQYDKIIDSKPVSSFLKENIVTDLRYDEQYILSIRSGSADPYTSCTFKTVTPEVSCKYTATQRTITLNSVSATSDESVTPRLYVKTDINSSNSKEFTGEKVTYKDLAPKSSYNLVYAYYNGKIVNAPSLTTKAIDMKRSATVLGPTAIRLAGSYDAGDAVVVESGWEGFDGGDNMVVTGMEPDRKYTFVYYVKTDDKRTFKATAVNVTTQKLELEIQAPKCVSSTNAIVAAKTNISEEEPGVGFQWKKYDAPASLPASEGYAVVCDGLIEGYIRNLQPTSYYNVRAFYKDANEKYYYSEWTTFDPSDFSFFEPTVRTYPIEEAGPTSAKLRGYALAGTDNIVSQGFQYWRTGAADGTKKSAPASGVMTVEAKGQVMTASLSNLTPGSVYGFRAYVETASGFTYGDEQTFETPELSGVDDVTTEAAPVEPVGYFDLSGRRYNTPRKGLNIVLYSDGTSRKMFVR